MSAPSSVNRILHHAEGYLRKGFRPVQVQRDTKSPTPQRWQHLIADPAMVREWFETPGFNLGVICGPQPNGINLLAIDLDGEVGEASWKALTAEMAVPDGPWHRTPHGRHLFFDAPIEACETTIGRLGAGIDTRGVGGQVVVPPSRFVDPETGEIHEYRNSADTCLYLVNMPLLMAELVPLLVSTPPPPRLVVNTTNGHSEIDGFDALRRRWDWLAELQRDGWTVTHQRGDQVFVCRPGKNPRLGHSAIVHLDSRHLVCWSPNVPAPLARPLRPRQVNRDGSLSWSPVDYFTAIHHHGDYGAAGRALAPPPPVVVVGERSEPEPAPPTQPPGLRLPVVDTEYWSASARNRHIFQAARAAMVSPDALDLVMFAFEATLIPPNYLLPRIVGGQQPLNFLACLVAQTGLFKTSTLDAARDLLGPLPPWVVQIGMGSGEGIGATFLEDETEISPKTGKSVKTGRLKRNSVRAALFEADEGSGLTEQARRVGATIIANLCKGWSGSTLGEANADPAKRRHVLDRDYRLAAVVNIQPSNFAGLFSMANTGTGLTGRFMFSGTADYEIPDNDVEWPGVLEHPDFPEMPLTVGLDERIVATAKERIRRLHREATLTSTIDAVGQNAAVVARMAAIAVLADGRRHITIDDWGVAQLRATTSARCLETLSAHFQSVQRDADHTALRTKAWATATVETETERVKIGQTTDRILTVLAAGPMSGGNITAKLAPSMRPFRDVALDALVGLGKVKLNGERWECL